MAGEGGGFRDLVVLARRREGERVVSLDLGPADGGPLAPFEPGQFLTFRIPGPEGRAVPRNYSLSGDPADGGRYRISVRREAPPALGSGFVHDRAEVGTRLAASGPKGRFVLDRASRRPVILVAEDIGLTPLLAMAQALAADPGRRTLLVHIATAPSESLFAEELAALGRRASHLQVRRLLDAVGAAAPAGYDGSGPLDAARLTAWLPIGDYEAYLCGRRAFLEATAGLLAELGVRPERILTETFEPARPAEALPSAPAAPAPAEAGSRPLVTFEPSGRAIAWDPACRTLLDFAEAAGFAPDFSCRNGICGTCRTPVDGTVVYVDEPLEMPEPGQALLCCSAPAGPVVVRL